MSLISYPLDRQAARLICSNRFSGNGFFGKVVKQVGQAMKVVPPGLDFDEQVKCRIME